MCGHPRCGKPAVYRLKETDYGERFDLCKEHGEQYQKNKGGKLLVLGRDIDEAEKRK